MKNIFLIITLLLFKLCITGIHGQTQMDVVEAKTATTVVGEFNGSFNTQIPLGTVTAGSLSVDFSLNYFNDGYKPHNMVSPFGHGWNLSHPGVIFKAQRGSNDANWTNIPFYQTISENPNLQNVINGTIDGAADLYTFNIMGYSGQFLKYNSSTLYMITKTEVIIQSLDAMTFKAILPNGNIVMLYSPTTASLQGEAWNAHEIYSYDLKDTIYLDYDNTTYQYFPVKDKEIIKLNSPSTYFGNPWPVSTVITSYLKKVTGKNNSLEINYGDRLDINDSDPLRCQNIKINNDSYCTNYELVTRHDNDQLNTSNLSHLRLHGIKLHKCTDVNDSIPGYYFKYYPFVNYGGGAFTAGYGTWDIDEYGYANLYGDTPSQNWDNMTPSNVPGGLANRTIHLESTLQGCLKEIKLSTGGKTNIEYEQHTYTKAMDNLINIYPQLDACSPSLTCYGTYIVSSSLVTLTTEQIQDGNLQLYIEAENLNGVPQGELYFYIKNSAGTILHTISFNAVSSYLYNIKLKNILNSSSQPILVAGNSYRFELKSINGYAYSKCNYYGPGSTPITQAGGLRVKKIINSNGNPNLDIITDYSYEGGVLYSSPRFYEIYNGYSLYYNRNLLDENFLDDSHIGYSKVTVSRLGQGKTVKRFIADYPKLFDANNRLKITSKLRHGVSLPTSISIYNNLDELLSRDSFEYQKLILNTNQIINYEYFINVGGSFYGYSYLYDQFIIRPLITRSYLYNNISPSNTIQYTYGHTHTLQASKIKITSDNGDITETITDYTNNFWQNNNIKNYFVSKNLIMPYTTETYENGKPIQGSTDDFSYYTSSGTFVGSTSNNSSDIVKLSKKYIGQYDGVSTSAIITPEEYACHEYNIHGFLKSDQKTNWPIKTNTFDIKERLTSISQDGFVSSFTYFGNSNLVQQAINVDGTYTDYTYDGLLRVKTKTEQPAGITTEYFYGYFTQTSGLNTVKTKTTYPLVVGSSVNIIENISFADKLGRKVATINIKGSPTQKDVITCYEYDNQGRIVKEYLPIETIYDNGTYIAPGSTYVSAGQVWKYKETKYETSPLSRIKEIIPPDWNYPTKYEYGLNLQNDYVQHQSGLGTYLANKLIKSTVIDGNGNKTITFRDFKNRLILSRITDATDTPSKRRDTYTHYDNKNRVIAVIPPDATINNLDLIFQYTYDNEDKVLTKKIPGSGIVKFYYNNKDLLAVQQDAVQAAKSPKEWLVFSYDSKGRQLKSGLNVGNSMPSEENPIYTTVYIEDIYGTTTIDKDKVKTNKVNILGTSNTLNTTYTYDTRGRVQNYISNNIMRLTASDVTSFSYDNANNVLSVTKPLTVTIGSTTSTHTVVSSTTYDHRGRSIDDNFKYNTGAIQTLSTNVYNWRNELIRVRQGKYNASTYLQDIDYSYRSNGLLERINDYLGTATSGDLFYMQFYYDNPIVGTTATTRKNGEIANIKWQRRNSTIVGGLHAYTYNEFGELMTNDFSTITGGTTFTSTTKFDETFVYNNKYSKITSLTRNDASGNIIDNLSYFYESNSPKTSHINDVSNNAIGHNQNGQLVSPVNPIYTYDNNGNQKKDPYRGVSNINYNHLDLPVLIEMAGGKKVEMTYDATGNMLTKKVFNTGAVMIENRTYNNGFEFVAFNTGNQSLELVHHAQGYYRQVAPGVFRYEYVIKDHLGNTRIVYTDHKSPTGGTPNGIVEQDEILDENHYYAYGMEMVDASYLNNSIYKYKFNGIERTESIGLTIDIALYRGLDPVLGKWYQVDPKAEAMMAMSPYCAMGNNPISLSDPDGDLPFIAVLAIGSATSIFSNGLSNLSQGKDFFDGAGKAALWGAISAGVSFGVGEAFGGTGSLSYELLRAGAHAATQGGISAAQGGSFWQGAASGGFGSLVGSAGIEPILGGGLGGGFGSVIAGGNFWQGFGQGLVVGAFNHALHNGAGVHGGGDPPTAEEMKAFLAGEYLGGRMTKPEYLYSLEIVDNNPGGLVRAVFNEHGTEIALTLTGGGILKFGGKVYTSFINSTGGLKQWFRYGSSYSHGLGAKTAISLRWGASPRYANKIGNIYLRQLNQWFRNLKLPGSNWRVNDSGHFHIKK